MQESERLNPRFDGAFLNLKRNGLKRTGSSLNPRFDGAFLNLLGEVIWNLQVKS